MRASRERRVGLDRLGEPDRADARQRAVDDDDVVRRAALRRCRESVLSAWSAVSTLRLLMPQLVICALSVPRVVALRRDDEGAHTFELVAEQRLARRRASRLVEAHREPEGRAYARRRFDVHRRRPSFRRAAC